MTDFLDEKQREMHERLNELKPLVEEARRLEAALRALAGLDVPPDPPAPNGHRPPRTRRGPTRGKQAVELVRARPGITLGEIAQHMGIKQNYLYRLLPDLERDGLIRKDGRGWQPVDAA